MSKWPIFGPGLLAAVLVAWCHAVFWATSNSLPLRWIVWLISFGPLAIWAKGDEPIFGRQMHEFLPAVSGWDACAARPGDFGLASPWAPPASPACATVRRSTCRD